MKAKTREERSGDVLDRVVALNLGGLGAEALEGVERAIVGVQRVLSLNHDNERECDEVSKELRIALTALDALGGELEARCPGTGDRVASARSGAEAADVPMHQRGDLSAAVPRPGGP